jgi:hypothetical protein
VTEHKGLPVHGYTDQSENAVATVNYHKVLEENILRQIDALADQNVGDPRWRAIARSHIEEGFMALNRSIFMPQRIKLPEDSQ